MHNDGDPQDRPENPIFVNWQGGLVFIHRFLRHFYPKLANIGFENSETYSIHDRTPSGCVTNSAFQNAGIPSNDRERRLIRHSKARSGREVQP